MSRATLSRYIAGRTLRSIGIAFMVVTAIIALVDYVEASRNIGTEADLSPLQLLKRSELTVMRAAGVSAWRFLRPALIVTGIIGILWATVINPLSSQMMGAYDARSAEALGSRSTDEIWLREGSSTAQRVIQAKSLDILQKRLDGPVFIEMAIDPDGGTVFERRFDAESARLVTPGYWTRIFGARTQTAVPQASGIAHFADCDDLHRRWGVDAFGARRRDLEAADYRGCHGIRCIFRR